MLMCNRRSCSLSPMTPATYQHDSADGATNSANIVISNKNHYNDIIMSMMTSQITSLMIVYSSFYSSAGQRKHQTSASLAFVRGIHRWPVNSPHKGSVMRKMFPFDEVIMTKSPHHCDFTDIFSDISPNLVHHEWKWYLINCRNLIRFNGYWKNF